MNRILQEYLNPAEAGKTEKEYGDRLFREGDKVMQIKNNYQLEWEVATKYGMTIDKGMGIFNGDMGIIREINTYEETVIVEYDEKRMVKYPYALLDDWHMPLPYINHRGVNILRWSYHFCRDLGSCTTGIFCIRLLQEQGSA